MTPAYTHQRSHPAPCAGTVEPGLYVYVEPAAVAEQETSVTPAVIDDGQTCYDTATLLPNVVPLLAAVPATGCGQDIIVSPLSTLLAVGAPAGLTADAIKAGSAPPAQWTCCSDHVNHLASGCAAHASGMQPANALCNMHIPAACPVMRCSHGVELVLWALPCRRTSTLTRESPSALLMRTRRL